MRKKSPLLLWGLIHIGIVLLLRFFPLYRRISSSLSTIFSSCVLHDYLFLYCPMCGGTRAVEALLHLEFAKAFSYNPLAMVGLLVALVLDGIFLVRILKKKEPIFVIKEWMWITFAAVLLLYGVLRNYLMIRYGYDPLGDLGPIWQILNS